MIKQGEMILSDISRDDSRLRGVAIQSPFNQTMLLSFDKEQKLRPEDDPDPPSYLETGNFKAMDT